MRASEGRARPSLRFLKTLSDDSRSQGAVTLLEERGKLKAEPGVHTPGYLFRDTKYVQRLEARGIEFQRVHHVPE